MADPPDEFVSYEKRTKRPSLLVHKITTAAPEVQAKRGSPPSWTGILPPKIVGRGNFNYDYRMELETNNDKKDPKFHTT